MGVEWRKKKAIAARQAAAAKKQKSVNSVKPTHVSKDVLYRVLIGYKNSVKNISMVFLQEPTLIEKINKLSYAGCSKYHFKILNIKLSIEKLNKIYTNLKSEKSLPTSRIYEASGYTFPLQKVSFVSEIMFNAALDATYFWKEQEEDVFVAGTGYRNPCRLSDKLYARDVGESIEHSRQCTTAEYVRSADSHSPPAETPYVDLGIVFGEDE